MQLISFDGTSHFYRIYIHSS